MDDWTYPYPDVDPPNPRPTLVARDRRVREARRLRAQQIEAGYVAERERMDASPVRDPRLDPDVPLPVAARPGAAPIF